MKQTYSELVKNELCHIKLDLNCSKAFLKSFFLNNLYRKKTDGQELWILKTHFPFLARYLIRMLKQLYDFKKLTVSYSNLNKNNFRKEYAVEFIGNFQQIITDLDLEKEIYIKDFDDCCLKAFVSAAFLSRGSIISPRNGNYHLEFQSYNENYLRKIKLFLSHFGIESFNIVSRSKKFILYAKRSEIIADVLRLMGLVETLFKYEDFRISRDLANNVQRLNNLDLSNLQKTVTSANEMIKMIKAIKSSNQFNYLSEKIKIYCKVRLAQKDISLAAVAKEMSRILKTPISKSNVGHITLKIKMIYEDLIKK